MVQERLSLVQSDLLSAKDESNGTWSTLQESAYDFMKEHKTEIAVGAVAVLAGTAGLQLLRRSSSGVSENIASKLGSSEITPLAPAITRGEAAFGSNKGLSWVGRSESVKISDLSHPEILPASAFDNAIVGRAPRKGEDLANTFMGEGQVQGEHFAKVMKSMEGIEIPRFAEEYAAKVSPGVAKHNIHFILDRAEMPPSSNRFWAATLANLETPGEFRSGQQLLREFLRQPPGTPSSVYAEVLASMKAREIPRFTREIDSMVSTSIENLEFYLSHAKVSSETKPVWEAALARLLQ